MASSSRDPAEEIAAGRLRRELYYRFAALELRLPPLRARQGDIPDLARHILAEEARKLHRAFLRFTPAALSALEAGDWPGNVRELESLILRAILHGDSARFIDAADIQKARITAAPRSLFKRELLEGRRLDDLKAELERSYLLFLFESKSGDLQALCRELGVNRATLYRWFRKLGMDIRELRGEGRRSR
jgi:DNA-binding NtrC family response regulator